MWVMPSCPRARPTWVSFDLSTPAFAGAGLYGAFGVKWFDVDPFGPPAEPRLMFPLISISSFAVVPVGMWAKASISPLFELAREAGEAETVGGADRPHTHR